MGASCAGSTTLGKAIAGQLNIPYYDTDEYFWVESDIPYTVKREPELRIKKLKADVFKQEDCIVGGSLVSWGEEWKTIFDLVVFLYLPPNIRLARLEARELERYGDLIYTDPERNRLYLEFIDWAKRYDDPTFKRRSLQVHEDWLNTLNCDILDIRGNTTVVERVSLVLERISKKFPTSHFLTKI